MDNALVSVIVPMYNAEKYIERCIESILSQTYKSWELIIVNDGSTDTSGVICKMYADNNQNIHYYERSNEGVSAARNYGLEQAKGKYIVFVDSDDWVSLEYLECMCDGYLLSKDISLVMVGHQFVTDGYCFPSILIKEKFRIIDSGEAINNIYDNKSYSGYLWNKMFRVDIIKNENLRFDQHVKICEDMLFCLQYMLCVQKVACSTTSLYAYYQNTAGTVKQNDIEKEKSKFLAFDFFMSIDRKNLTFFSCQTRKMYALECLKIIYVCEFKKDIFDKSEIEIYLNLIDENNLVNYMGLKARVKYLAVKYMPRLTFKMYRMINTK